MRHRGSSERWEVDVVQRSDLGRLRRQAANYPFCTIEPNNGEIGVPDSRLEVLSGIVNPSVDDSCSGIVFGHRGLGSWRVSG